MVKKINNQYEVQSRRDRLFELGIIDGPTAAYGDTLNVFFNATKHIVGYTLCAAFIIGIYVGIAYDGKKRSEYRRLIRQAEIIADTNFDGELSQSERLEMYLEMGAEIEARPTRRQLENYVKYHK